MVTFIEIILGSNEGSRFKVEAGLTLGRSKADIVIKDPKISSTHAKFGLNSKDQLVLNDLDSSNGIYISGRRVKKVALLPGVIFEVGRTQFKVVTVQEEEAVDFSRFVTWRTIVSANLGAQEIPNKPQLGNIEAFSPPVKLTFIQGIQTEEELVLGYGPRKAGADSLDIELFEEDAPQEAFELVPGLGAVQIKIKEPGRVLLNNKRVNSEILKDGDLISLGNTLIKVTYL
ncbi:FHA domain-containing protein [Bdellovibrio sp. HCB2-146]|uniref:FHA domain-containing protein n=1 Tax=Bdellovibrio sp. HCB2-146 TaxID=3394362 RepID=UPI0039BC5921